MPLQTEFLTNSFHQSQEIFDKFVYSPDNGDDIIAITTADYFANSPFIGNDFFDWENGILEIQLGGAFYVATISADGASAVLSTGSVNSFAPNFQSANQAIPAAAGQATVAHGLGATPVFVDVELINLTAEFGYAVGERIKLNEMGEAVTLSYDATNIDLDFTAAGTPVLVNKSTNLGQAITRANWAIIFKAWV